MQGRLGIRGHTHEDLTPRQSIEAAPMERKSQQWIAYQPEHGARDEYGRLR